MTGLDYVTVAEIGFAPYLLNLHKSLIRHAGDFHLTVACAEPDLLHFLRRLDLPRVTPLDLSSPLEAGLFAARQSRTIGEYCWTLTPFLPGLVFDSRPDVETVTYIDADMWLLKSPQPIHDEFEQSGAACMITPHAFSPEWDASHSAGFFCVQYMPFRRGASEEILSTWAAQCVDQCSAAGGPLGLGDQGYLTNWPDVYGDRVRVTGSPQWFQGPWNCERYPYSEAIAYHFHGVRLRDPDRAWLGTNPIPSPTYRFVYEAYLRELRDSVMQVTSNGGPLRFWPHPMSRIQQAASVASRSKRRGDRLLSARSRVLPHD
jgi:hypothetical protein